MSSGPRPPRPRTARSSATASSRLPLLIAAGVVAVVVIALVVALVTGSGDDDTTETGGTTGPEVTTDQTGTTVADDTPATVTGTALPPLPDSGADPAAGTPMPTLSGTALDGQPLTIPTAGRPTMIVFVAHWCPHCQAEVPVVQQWVDDGGLPDGVDLVTVSTAVDPRRPNYPPAEWLEHEGWTAPVLVDGDEGAASAAGLTAYPFFVGVDGDGNVAVRTSGELDADQLTAIAEQLIERVP